MAFRAVTPCTRGLIIEKPRREERGGVKILDRGRITLSTIRFSSPGYCFLDMRILVVGFREIKKNVSALFQVRVFFLYLLYEDIKDF